MQGERWFVEVHKKGDEGSSTCAAEIFMVSNCCLGFGKGLPRNLSAHVAAERARSLWGSQDEGCWTVEDLQQALDAHQEGEHAEAVNVTSTLKFAIMVLGGANVTHSDLGYKARLLGWRVRLPEQPKQ